MSKRYFINNIDSFLGTQLLSELYKTNDEDQGQDEVESRVMGTYTDPQRTDKPKSIKKILKRYKPKLSRKKMLEENDVWIYDTSNQQDLTFATEILENIPTLEEPKVLILVSDIRTWGATPKKQKITKIEEIPVEEEKKEEEQVNQEDTQELDEEEKKDEDEEQQENTVEEEQVEQVVKEEEVVQEQIVYEAYKESDYQTRVPLEEYGNFKAMEDQVLALQKENLKVIVICPGVLYGAGEIIFKQHFKAAWKQDPVELPYLGEGENMIPTINVKDLIKFIIKVAEAPPENERYLLAVDNAKEKTQKAIIQAISTHVGSGQIRSVESDPMFDKDMNIMLSLDLDFRPSAFLVGDEEAPVDFEWSCEKGLTQNVPSALKEFKKSEKLRPIKICVYYPESQEKDLSVQTILNETSNAYRIPIITMDSILQHVLSLDNELKQEVQENYDAVVQASKEEHKQLTETNKLLYRCVKQRLTQNDCSNRGFILVNCPTFAFDCDIVFYQQKNRLKAKKAKVVKQTTEEGEEEQQEEQEEQQEQEGEEDTGPKFEEYYPESIVVLKQLSKNERFNISAFNFFKQRSVDLFIYDPVNKPNYEIQETLRVYIERNGRPYNYIKDDVALKQEFDAYISKVDQDVRAQKAADIQSQVEKQETQQQLTNELLNNVYEYVRKEVNNQHLKEKNSLRSFLMSSIVPTLSDGLLEVSKVKPDDPQEFLAEYLFEKSFDLQ